MTIITSGFYNTIHAFIEGWNVILDEFDWFLEYKMTKQFGKMFEKNKHPSEYSRNISDYLWNWISMVLSRTMDTAIIHIKDPS